MLDDDDGIPSFDEAIELGHQLLDIVRVQASRRFVQNVERAAAVRPLQLGRELDALGLAAGKLGRRLA